MNSKHKSLIAITAALLLAACTTIAPRTSDWREQGSIEDFNADGRLAVKMNDKGSYANFDWTYQNGVQTIDVNTPIGSTVGQLCQDSRGVLAVNSNGQVFEAGSAQELSERLLGYSLPVQYLNIWSQGQWVKGVPHQIDPQGRLQQFEWTISRTLKADGTPRELLLESQRLTLRLVFDTLQKLPADANAPQQCAARSGA